MQARPGQNGGTGLDLFCLAWGGFFGLTLLKFGNAVVVDKFIEPPGTLAELAFQAWPVRWGEWMGLILAALGLPLARRSSALRRLWVWLPAVWFGLQLTASVTTIDGRLSAVVIAHFAVCLGSFYGGLLVLGRCRHPLWFWGGLLGGFCCVLWVGLEQHFGGLEATRRYVYEQPGWESYPTEFLKRIGSNRVFATMASPNALAGLILLLLPPTLVTMWRLSARLTVPTRGFLTALLGASGLGILYWSGSKGGWLIALALVTTAFFRMPIRRSTRILVISALILSSALAFAVRHRAYFDRGATSVVARFDYWKVAWRVSLDHPALGTGPGTFATVYARLKPPEAEMTRLVHNDYLQQACDSGWVAAAVFAAFVVGSVVVTGRRSGTDPLRSAAWVGVTGWALHSTIDYGLYVPALSWTALAVLGWLWATQELSASSNAGTP